MTTGPTISLSERTLNALRNRVALLSLAGVQTTVSELLEQALQGELRVPEPLIVRELWRDALPAIAEQTDCHDELAARIAKRAAERKRKP